ncbi:unnamed protein product [Calypogeia fissa]
MGGDCAVETLSLWVCRGDGLIHRVELRRLFSSGLLLCVCLDAMLVQTRFKLAVNNYPHRFKDNVQEFVEETAAAPDDDRDKLLEVCWIVGYFLRRGCDSGVEASKWDAKGSHWFSISSSDEVPNVDVLRRLNNGNDEEKLTLNISGDLRSVFTWNTKQLFVFVVAEYKTPKNQINQVSLWDLIVERKEDALSSRRLRKQICLCGPSTCL